MTTRRELLQLAGAMLVLPGFAAANTTVARAGKPLDILILGGTGFLGPLQVEHALQQGHRVTLFNRGRSAPGMFGDRVEVLLGNRDARIEPGLQALQGGRRWDTVIDNSGYVPRHVRDSTELLRDRIAHYVFVSTVAVYDRSGATAVFDESSALWKAPVPSTEVVSGATYGPLKAECDRIVQSVCGDRATIVRPSFIFGPGDDTDRFTYWVDRMARGGEVLGPPEPDTELQWIDVRDLCPWIVELAQREPGGIYNAAGPSRPTTWRQVLQELTRLATRPTSLRWSTVDVLKRSGIELPLVRPGSAPHFVNTAALAAGLDLRSLADTAAATLAWWRSQPETRRAQAEGWPTASQEEAALRLLAGAQ